MLWDCFSSELEAELLNVELVESVLESEELELLALVELFELESESLLELELEERDMWTGFFCCDAILPVLLAVIKPTFGMSWSSSSGIPNGSRCALLAISVMANFAPGLFALIPPLFALWKITLGHHREQ